MAELGIDLPLLWAAIIVVGVVMYVLLDGFDLGVGILFPFLPTDQDRDLAMNSVAPIWDGNETWLVLGGAGLFAAFPLAYAVILPGTYLPLIIMLLGLIFRGVAFEFRFKAHHRRHLWDKAFHYGSLAATIAQGMVLGAFIQGFEVENRQFAGGMFDWLTPFSLLTGAALISGYALLGATWLIMKTERELQERCYRLARGLLDRGARVHRHRQRVDAASEPGDRGALVYLAEHRLAVARAGGHRAGRVRPLARARPAARGPAVRPVARAVSSVVPRARDQPVAERDPAGHLDLGGIGAA